MNGYSEQNDGDVEEKTTVEEKLPAGEVKLEPVNGIDDSHPIKKQPIPDGVSANNDVINEMTEPCSTTQVTVDVDANTGEITETKTTTEVTAASNDAGNEVTESSTTTQVITSSNVEHEVLDGSGEGNLVGEIVISSTRVVKTTKKTTFTSISTTNGEMLPPTSSSERNVIITEEKSSKTTTNLEIEEPEKAAEVKGEVSPSPPKTSSRASPLPVRPSQYVIPEIGDRYKPAKSLISTRPDEGVLLRYTKTGPLSDPPLLVPTMLQRTTDKFPNMTALAVKRDNDWKKWTYTEMMADIKAVAKSFIHLGLERYHGVGILGFNSPEWFLANFGAIFSGGLSVGIYATNNPEACEWQLKDCRANICICENDKQLEKILKVWPNLPNLKAVIQWTGKPSASENPKVHVWSDIVELGRTLPDTDYNARMADLAVNQCCTLIYTSGTTGPPKGVMLSHDNLTWTAVQCSTMALARPGVESNVSYLPLSHVAAQMMDMYIPFSFGCTIYFAQPDALRGSLANTLAEVRPTLLLGVPRVWEKIQLKMVEQINKSPAIKRSLIRWAKSVGLRGARAQDKGEPMPAGWNIANSLVFKKVRQSLGLDQGFLMFTGAAPIMTETLDFFRSFNLRILDAYGMSECSCPHTINWPHSYRFGSSGKSISGAITHIKDPGEDGTGEICMEGRHVFMGYLFNPEQTMETLDENGWLHSGDVGKVDEDGFLYITGRIKELIITAGGENVPPIILEDMLKAELPVLSQVMVIGDRRKFLSALLTLKTEVDTETMVPRDRLAPATIDWANSLGSKVTKVSEILEKNDLPILKVIQAAVDKVNERATSQAQRIQKWTLLPRDFSIPGGELGPTLKMRRPVIAKMYKDTIESFYSGHD